MNSARPFGYCMPMRRDPTSERNETETERVDRNLEELMAELRVALPGVQVLFAFLLILPFNNRFEQVSELERKVYLGTLLCAAVCALLLIAPTVNHRLLFRADRKARILAHSQRLALGGLALLAVAMAGAVFLVGDFVFGGLVAGLAAGLVTFVVAVSWYLLPALQTRPPRP